MSNVSRHMQSPANRVASALFACCALAPLGLWYILLFVGAPSHQTAAEHAASQLLFSFRESGATWHFALLVALPVAFAVLAVAAWRSPAGAWRASSWHTVLAVVSIALVVFVMWEVALFAIPALLLAVRHRDG
jgi:hypothetical protein